MEETELNALNKIAQQKFAEIKSRILQVRTQPIANRLMESLLDVVNENDKETIIEKRKEEVTLIRENVDRTLELITSMKLPNTLSLAVGYIFAFKETNDKSYLAKAISEINREVNTVNGPD